MSLSKLLRIGDGWRLRGQAIKRMCRKQSGDESFIMRRPWNERHINAKVIWHRDAEAIYHGIYCRSARSKILREGA